MHATIQTDVPDFQKTTDTLCLQLAQDAPERDAAGGTPKLQRDLIRQSGLLKLSIPREFGGWGANWLQTLQVVRKIARADSSVAHVFAFHHLLLATIRLFGSPSQWQHWYRTSAGEGQFWGNTLNPLDHRTQARRAADGSAWIFEGEKSFCSGALDSDMLLASAVRTNAPHAGLLIATVPTRRHGITLRDDWDNIGQRQTDSGSAHFNAVRIADDEILSNPGPLSSPFASLRSVLAQLVLTNLYVGLAEGAFHSALSITRGQSRPWISAGVGSPQEEPYILRHYGEFWAGLESARLLTDHALKLFDAGWERGIALTADERTEIAVATSSARAVAAQQGLDITSRIFDVTGARATTAALRLDRFWRNLRVHTLHDPIDYKLKELGQWVLNATAPAPSFYS